MQLSAAAARAISGRNDHRAAAPVLGPEGHRRRISRSGCRLAAWRRRLLVPFDAIKSFFDPSVQFGLQFETIAETGRTEAAPTTEAPRGRSVKPPGRRPSAAERKSRGKGGCAGRASVPAAARARPKHRRTATAAQPPDKTGGESRQARPLPQEVMARRRPPSAHLPQDIDGEAPHRDRYLRPDRGGGRPLLGRADPALASRISGSAPSACRSR